MLKTLCGTLLALTFALSIAQEAGAKPRTFTIPGGEGFSFTLQSSNRHQLEVRSSGRRWIDVRAMSLGSGATGTLVNYNVRRRPWGEDGFEAKLPGIGRIAVEFRPRGKPKALRLERGCTGKPGQRESGAFVGTINFHGERGYTEVTATRAKGKVRRSYRQTCSIGEGPKKGGGGKGGVGKGGDGGGESFEEMIAMTTLTALTPRGGTYFLANRIELRGELAKELELPAMLTYSAMKVERSHGMRVTRFAISDSPVESFSAEHTGRAAAARVEPSEPFSGSADFGVERDGTVNWTGDLGVALPGAEPIRLTGKRFEAELCVEAKCAGDPMRPTLTLVTGIFALLAEHSPSSAAPTPRPWLR